MSNYIKLTAEDGHPFDAYVAEPPQPAKAAIVLIQGTAGVNSHIRSVADDYATAGFYVIAPSLFDRVRPHIELGYAPNDIVEGIRIATQIGPFVSLKDVAAALAHADSLFDKSKVAVLGFGLGGTLAWLAAARLHPAAAIAYYAAGIAEKANETPCCPTLLHFGAKDSHVSLDEIDKIQTVHKDIPIFIYDVGHGFNCPQRHSYNAEASALARNRTLDFLKEHLLNEEVKTPL
jgi:carboxymethylenebutenolidase